MRHTYSLTLVVILAFFISSCNSGYTRRNPGRIYAPDMQYSVAYNAFTENPVTKNGLTSQLPVKGTVARGKPLPMHLTEADMKGYFDLKFPRKFSAADIKQGEQLFDIYCGICHGEKLDGQGPLFTSGKFVSMPADLVGGDYYLNLSPGMIYHTIMYGKNMMGSYASQLNEEQRWKVIAYVKIQQDKVKGVPFPFMNGNDSLLVQSDSSASAAMSSATADSTKTNSDQESNEKE